MRAQPRMLAQMALPSHSGKLSADLYADYRVQLPRTSDDVQQGGRSLGWPRQAAVRKLKKA